jgi:4-amino-4-deoxy-L-arabinose transferase-like glycosyltransferase
VSPGFYAGESSGLIQFDIKMKYLNSLFKLQLKSMTHPSNYFIKTFNEKQMLLLLIGITFVLRLYAVLMAQGIANDSVAYGFAAKDFFRGHFIKGLSSPTPPFYPFLISLFSVDPTYVEITGRCLSLFIGTLTILPLFYLVKKAFGQKEAIFSALFYSFHSYLVIYSGMFLTEATYWGLLILSVFFFWTGLKEGKFWKMVLSGSFLGLAYLTRPEGIGFILIYLIWVVLDRSFNKKWLKKVGLIGFLILPVFVFVIPYVIYIHRETGQWLISKKAAEEQSQLFEKRGDKPHPFLGVKRMNPRKNYKMIRITRNIVQNLPSVIYHYLRAFHFSLWLFLFFGLIRVKRKGIIDELFLASLVLFHLFSLSILTSSTIRFSVPIIPLSLFWAGIGILEIKRYLGKIKISHPEKIIFILILLLFFIQLPQSLKPERRHRVDDKKIGIWLKHNTPPDAIIMSNSPQETFYAGRDFILLPQGISTRGDRGKSYHEVIQYAKAKGVRYILVDKNTHEVNPDFMESIQPTDLKEIFKNADKRLIIYEVIY